MITLGQTAYQPSTRMPPTSGRWAGWDWTTLYQGVLTAIQYPVNTLNYVRALDYITNLPKIMVFNYPVLLAAWVRFTKLYPAHNHAAALRYMEALLRATGRFQDTEDKAKWWMIEQEWQSLEGAAPQIRGLSGFPFVFAGEEPALGQLQWLRRGVRVYRRRPRPRLRRTPRRRVSVRRTPAVAIRPRAATRPVTRARVVRRRTVRQPIKWMTWPIRPIRRTAPRPPAMPQPPRPPTMPEPQPPPMPAGLGQTLPYLPDEYPGQIILPVIIPPPPSLYPGPPTQLRKRHKLLAWIGFLGLLLLHKEPAAGPLLSGVSIKKNALGYAVTPKERRAGMKLMYFLKLRRRRKPVAINKDSFDHWKTKRHEADVYATYAYSAEHGRELIAKGEVKPYTGQIHRPEEAHITEAGKVKPLYSMTHTELVNTPFQTRVELPSYIAWMIDKSKPDEYNYQRQFQGKLPYKMRGNLYSWLLKNRDGVKGGRHEGQFSLKLTEGTLNFYIPENPYAQVRLWINRYSLWRDAVSSQMEQGIPLRSEVVGEYRKSMHETKRMLSERPTSPEAPEMRTELSKMESSLSVYEGKLQRAREIREKARRELQRELRRPEPAIVRPKRVEPPRPAKKPEPEQLRLFGNLQMTMFYIWYPKGKRRGQVLNETAVITASGRIDKRALEAADRGEGKIYHVPARDREDALQRSLEARADQQKYGEKGSRIVSPYNVNIARNMYFVRPHTPERAARTEPAPRTAPQQLRLLGNRTSFKLSDPSPIMSKDWIAAQIRRAIEEDPGRRVHGDTRYNAFFITPEREIVPFDMLNTLEGTTPAMDTISVHSHSGNNWRQFVKRTGNLEPFNPLNDMDIQAFQQMVLMGIANTDVLIMADGRMEVLHVPPESEKNFISLQPPEFGILRPTYDYYASVYRRTGKQAHEVDKQLVREFADRYNLVYYDDNWLPPEPEPLVKEKPSGIRKTFTKEPFKETKTKKYYISPFYVEPGVYPGIPEQMEIWRERPPVQQRLLGRDSK